jgi:hypothetical protein
MTAPLPDDVPRELLAAYADGELDDPSRERVERWLATHPEAIDELRTQRSLSPANASLWDRAEPPEPSARAWAAAWSAIDHRLASPILARRRRHVAWALTGLATAGVAAAVVWIAIGTFVRHDPKAEPKAIELAQSPNLAPHPREIVLAPAPRSIDPIEGFAILPMANNDDVVLERVPEFPAGWLPVGRHPLDGILVLATVDELLLGEVSPSSAWPPGGPKMTTSPGDAPMIFAGKLR